MSELFAAAFWATFDIMKNVIPSLLLGLFLANISTSSGVAAKGQRFIPLITKITGLPTACALSVVLALGDRTAGMAAVAQARNLAVIGDREVIAANLVAKAPSVLQFFLFSFIPIMAAMYPKDIAVRFLTVYFLSFAFISLLGIGWALLIRRSSTETCQPTAVAEGASFGGWRTVAKALGETWRPLLAVSTWMAGMSFVVMLFIKTGYLNRLTEQLPLLARLGIDGSILSLAGAGLVSMLGGVAAVGAALRDGALPAQSVVPLLFTISLLHNIYDFFIGSLPRNIAVYGHRLGLKSALVGFIVTQAVMVAAIVLTIKGWL
ncbi:MAG: hypothetical protein P4N41_05095 [Negativicutes bacterium]|nr:hypothetical protein [Negativicutes bacterium]